MLDKLENLNIANFDMNDHRKGLYLADKKNIWELSPYQKKSIIASFSLDDYDNFKK